MDQTDYYQSHINYGNINENSTMYYSSSNNIVKQTNMYYSNPIRSLYNGLHVRKIYDDYYYSAQKNCYFAYSTYTIEQLSQKLDSVITKVYDSNFQNPILSRESYIYNDMLLPTTVEKTQSDKSNIKTKYQYPSDINTGIYASMANQNRLNTPIEERTLKNDYVIGSKLTTYKEYYSGRYVPDKIYELEVGTPVLSANLAYFNGSNDELLYSNNPEINFVQYDIAAKINQISTRDGLNTVYLWSYNHQYPIAEIKNATYAEVSTGLQSQGTTIDQLSASASPDISKVDGLRSLLPNALVTTYIFKPLIGLVTATDSRGVTTNYTYDTFNRLYLARNDDKNIVGRYRYGYQNAPDNGLGGYATLTASVTPGATSYTSGATGTASLSSLSGGSGNYTFSWYLKNSSATVLASSINTTSTSFSYLCSQTGTLTIQCVITDNLTGTTFSTSASITVTAGPPITMQSSYTSLYQNITLSGSTVSFNFTFLSMYTLSAQVTYLVGNISTNFRPSTTRVISYSTGGRTWAVIIAPNGNVSFMIAAGTALPAQTGVGFTSLSYSL